MKTIFNTIFEKKSGKLKWDIVRILILAWIIPVALLTIVIVAFTSDRFNDQIKETIITSSEKAVEICETRLNNAMSASRNASYLHVIRDSIYQYQEDNKQLNLYNSITQYLGEQYRYNDDFVTTIVFLTDNPDLWFYTINNSAGATYNNVLMFNYNAKHFAVDMSKELDTDIGFVTVGERLYMVRNIMDSHFKPLAVIVMEINPDSVFGSLQSVVGYKDCRIVVDDEIVVGCDKDNRDYFNAVKNEDITETLIVRKDDIAIVGKESELKNSHFKYYIMLDGDTIFSGSKVILYMLIGMSLFLIPLIVLVFYYFHKKVTKPLQELSNAAKEITAENYGYQIEDIDYSDEFRGLGSAFNRMSKELKHQFEQRYIEELALRDANIRALQSQINPHFLNNTLEIINWEARMSGNDKISGMIEALSTMTEATMNRKKQPMVTLEEELTYVDAYLYIIRQRFGSKFELESETEDGLEDVMVPRLIIQPIIENAVEHGGDNSGYKRVAIRISRENDTLKMVITNNGRMSDEDIQKVERLLSDDYDDKNDTSVSIGIRNVNKRLKIIYGKEYGLTIKKGNDNETVSTILAKID